MIWPPHWGLHQKSNKQRQFLQTLKIIFILGPTAAGKTERAIQLAQQLKTHIISCDSRQFYTELNIGVARPSEEELAAAPHHFIACRSVRNPYNVFTFQEDALSCIEELSKTFDTLVAVGGSSLYIQALTHGISVLPDPAPELRKALQDKLHNEGVESLRSMLKRLDPDYYARVDLANGVRIQRALEVCITTGTPYSQLINKPLKPRSFQIESEIVSPTREILRQRIDARVRKMMDSGLEQEARDLYPLRNLTALNTVGYKEFFSIWDKQGTTFPLTQTQEEEVIESICLNTWHYAKKQLTWLKKYSSLIQQ